MKQLNQRCKDFLAYLADQGADTPSNGHAMTYRDVLIQRGLSHKSLKDYLAANRQFFNWCVAKEFIKTNPFAVVKIPKKGKSTSRARWKAPELKALFASKAYQAKGEQFDWITKIQMYQGCRPSEACQLRLEDIRLGDNPSIHFSDAEEKQHLKNASLNRIVPIHKVLIKLGLLEYAAQRRQQGATQLFDLTPRGDDLDWSNDYRDALGHVLDKCGFKAGDRATAYSFRHTFIDELQKVGVQEHVVAQIVGHKHQSMTYGHYAKNLDLKILREAVNRFDVSAI
ncbi:tyrosine-type recombinase/integrase [Vibrio sp. DNB22_10_4]